MNRTDRAWRYFGRTDPYFGVLTHDEFRKENLDENVKSAFFDSGEDYIDQVFSVIRDHLDEGFQPMRALDFGCGVGRLTVPLARRCSSVLGVDISPAMLAETESNARQAGLANVQVAASDDALGAVAGKFDLIHSFIVFQHITPHRGEAVLGEMVRRLADGGVGVVHFTYANSSTTPPPLSRRWLTRAYAKVPLLYGMRNLVKGDPLRHPPMEMNLYNINELLRLLQESGCHDIHIRFTETSHFGFPVYGVVLYFLKKRLDVTTHH